MNFEKKKIHESYFSYKELRRSMYMSYGRYDICMVRRDAQREKPCVCDNDHKTYTWNDVILYKRSMIRVFEFNFRFLL